MRQQYHSRLVGADRHVWDVHRLVRLSDGLPVTSMPISNIAELDEDWWYDETNAVPTPRSIAAHMELVQQTDLSHPLILCSAGRLMDGMHRAVKALLEKQDRVKVVRFAITPTPDFVNVSLDCLPYDD